MTPQVTQALFELGLGAWVVGAPETASIPLAARVPSIGKPFALSLEAVVRLRPGLAVCDSQAPDRDLTRYLAVARIDSFCLDFSDAGSLESSVRSLYRKLELTDTESRVSDRLRCLDAVGRSRVARGFSFIVLISTDPIIVFGQDTFLSRTLAAFGGENRAPIGYSFPRLNGEWLLRSIPDRIYYLRSDLSDTRKIQRVLSQKGASMIELDSEVFSRVSFEMLRNLSALGIAAPAECM